MKIYKLETIKKRNRKISEAMKGRRKGKHWKLVDGKRIWY